MKKYDLKSPIKNTYRTLPGMVVDILREAILSGELSGGTQLKQEELALQFGVSMSVLREALKTLEGEGFVRFYPNRGAMVTELSAAEAQEIFDIRLFLELGAIELTIPHLTADDVSEAGEILQTLDAEPHSGRWSELNWQFHEVLYRASNRPRLLSLIQNMHNNVERYMRLYLSAMKYQEESQDQHRAILHACAQRDVRAAQRLLREHISAASARLIGYIQH